MSYHIRKMTPIKRKASRQFKRQNSNNKQMDQLSSVSPTKSTNSDYGRIRLSNKLSLQTIICSKTTYVEKLNLTSTSWCIYDAKKSRYLGFRERTQRQIASLTKIMTTIIAIQFFEHYKISENTMIKVTVSSSKLIGTSAELKTNTWVYLWDLLYGCMLPSGNDAASLISEYVGYFLKNRDVDPTQNPYIDLTSENTNILTVQFIKLMNSRAQSLGLSYTTFSNPHGLQNAMNRSTPKDIIILSQYASANQKFRQIMNTDTHSYHYYQQPTIKDNNNDNMFIENNNQIKEIYKKQRRRWWNTNILLKKGWEGIKTGQTIAAGGCLASLKNDIYVVVLNCKDGAARFAQTQKIYQWYIGTKSQGRQTADSQSNNEL